MWPLNRNQTIVILCLQGKLKHLLIFYFLDHFCLSIHMQGNELCTL